MGYKDPVRTDVTLVEVEVENRNTRYLVLPSINNAEKPNILQPGKSKILLYTDELPLVQAMVETRPDLIDAAKKRFEGKWRAYLAEKGMGNLPDGDPAVRAEREIYNDSIEACFRELTIGEPGGLRDLLPLVSCTVLRENIIPPEAKNPVVEAMMLQRQQADQAVSKEVAELRAQVAELKAMLKPQTQVQPNQQRR